ncbi:hypothetical protein [Campylobacter hyointestinalis]|uniref:hypothetical protein n=1 Tax=Campylobacter hyointestinalis TaxID=198 RepID=UPI0025527A83|nr:hypothetical protein [Campylobacter hyointestinalis]MDL2349953.1 hypothetical protein [Campylobacter hyointestinalis]MDM1025370.1 hypothetical protein [Campylobacter hyointestinalis]
MAFAIVISLGLSLSLPNNTPLFDASLRVKVASLTPLFASLLRFVAAVVKSVASCLSVFEAFVKFAKPVL